MSRSQGDASQVHAPAETMAWVASHGWVDNHDHVGLEHARRLANNIVLPIDDDRWLRNLTGPAPLAAVVHIDRDLHELADRFAAFLGALVNLAEES